MLLVHVVLSLVGLVSGIVVVYGLLTSQRFGGWTALFLATTILTSVTGFLLPPFAFDPARAIGLISLVLLAWPSVRAMSSVSLVPGVGSMSFRRSQRFTSMSS
jgi:hypothetical protein